MYCLRDEVKKKKKKKSVYEGESHQVKKWTSRSEVRESERYPRIDEKFADFFFDS